MNSALELAGVAVAALLSENFILVNCLGTDVRAKSLQDPVDALRSGYCLTLVMALSALFAWTVEHLLLAPMGWGHFRLLILALFVPGLVAVLRRFFRACLPELSRRMDGNLAAVSTNCAALGSALLVVQRSYSLGASLVFALFGGVGATLVLASFASLQLEVDLESCPRAFRGLPIKLITAGLMAMSLVGFYGLHLD